MEVFTAATLAALAAKVTSVLKYLSAGDWRAALTQVIPWLAGFVCVALAAQANVAEGLVVWGDVALGDLNVWSLLLAGLALGSGASFAYDVKKAIDNTDSATEPPLQLGSVAEPTPDRHPVVG